MTPLYQTLLTLFCMGLAYWWGNRDGYTEGINVAIRTLIDNDFITDKDLERLQELTREIDDD